MENESFNIWFEEPNVYVDIDRLKIDIVIDGQKCNAGEVATMRVALAQFAEFLSEKDVLGENFDVLRKDYLKNVNSVFAKMKVD